MKTIKLLVASTLALIFIGCTPKVITIKKNVYVPKIVKVPVMCKMPIVECDYGTGGISTLRGLLECVETQKAVISTCRSKQVVSLKKYRPSND